MKLALAFLLPLITIILAAPGISSLTGYSVISKFGIIKLMSQYSAAAYCPQNYNMCTAGVACRSGGCQMVQKASTTLRLVFNQLAANGFVVLDETHKMIVVAFRGTVEAQDFWTDIKAWGVLAPELCRDCEVHGGFWGAWKEVRMRVVNEVRALRSLKPDYMVYVTGHSLGGALAEFAALTLRDLGIPTNLYMFGSPRPGNQALADYAMSQPGENINVVSDTDHIPLFPPAFSPISPLFVLTTGKADISPSQILVQPPPARPYDVIRNKYMDRLLDFTLHRLYFGPISKCAPDDPTPGEYNSRHC
ncbi:MAG: hypothetical protein M1826_002643 [Phylliscum demangeonii]|nr:MAG: hypothetical protein M1826_002643 [Phylliscum demangeonii]